MSLATMTATLKLNIADFASQLGVASSKLTKFASKTQEDYGKASAALKSHNLGLKDTARIVQGIVISQTFYTAANAIRSATSALWEFNKELDYAHITYSALFGSTDLANKFSTVLQEHAVETIFDYQQLSNVSKKLLAYGIEYKNLMYVMEGMTNLGAMSGDVQAMDRIGLALGQIKTTGYLTATEMRQLSNAYVPIYDIVQNAFGLSGDQMQKIGDLKLPAHEVINAVVDYANERFGAVGDAAMMTITGLENRIVDTLKVVGSAMIEPITSAYKSMLVYISSGLEELRNAYDTGGLGGIFEFLVPDDSTQTTIRQFIANVKNLLMSLMSVVTTLGTLFGNFAHVVVTAFNIVTPVVTNVVNVLSAMLNAMLQNSHVAAILRIALVAAAGAFVLLRVQAASALIITAVTKAVTSLSSALVMLASIISKHPIISLLFALGIALVGVSSASNKANKAISGLFDGLSGISGMSSKDILQPVEDSFKDSANAADEFNKRLEEGTGAAKDLTDAIGGTGKAANKVKDAVGLLSFDEVFKLPEKADSAGTGSGIGSGLAGALGGLGDVFSGLSDSLIPDIPDFGDYIKDFTDGLFGGLSDSIVDKLKSIGIGALIGGTLGAIIGGIIGGPGGAILGAKIGAFAGGIAGLIWEELEGALTNTGVGAAAGVLGAIAKSLTKAGATGLGTLLKNAFASGGLKGVWTALAGTIKSTGLKSILKGGVIGAAVGLIVDGLAHLLWSWMAESIEGANADTAKVGQTIGSVLGTIIGAIAGGPGGAVIGSAIGTFVGGLIGLFWESIKGFFVDVGTAIGEWLYDTDRAIEEGVTNSINKVREWSIKLIASFNQWCTDTANKVYAWVKDTTVAIADWVTNNINKVREWSIKLVASFNQWCTDTANKTRAWVNDTTVSIANWITDTRTRFVEWRNSQVKIIADWAKTTLTRVGSWLSDTWTAMRDWFTETKQDIADWWNNLFVVRNWKSGWSSIKEWFTNLFSDIRNWFTSLKNSITNWWDGLWSDKKVSVSATANTIGQSRFSLAGHATGGIFSREHIARFAEGNRAEAIIPLENNRAMQPFVDAVSSGLVSSLAPIVANINASGSGNLPPLYVGTLIADDRGIKQLYDKFEVIRLQESDRRGIAHA